MLLRRCACMLALPRRSGLYMNLCLCFDLCARVWRLKSIWLPAAAAQKKRQRRIQRTRQPAKTAGNDEEPAASREFRRRLTDYANSGRGQRASF